MVGSTLSAIYRKLSEKVRKEGAARPVGRSGRVRRRLGRGRPRPSFAGVLVGRLLGVAAELLAHGRQDAVGEVALAPGGKTLVQGGAEHGRRYRLVDGGHDCPAALPGIRNVAAEARQPGI